MAPGCPAAPAGAAAAPAARPAATPAAAGAGAAGRPAARAAGRASAPVHRGHRRRCCRCSRRSSSRSSRRGQVGTALGLGTGGHEPRGRGGLIARAGGGGGLRALRGGFMDLQDKSREGRPEGTGCECSCCEAGSLGTGRAPRNRPCAPRAPQPGRRAGTFMCLRSELGCV